MSDEEKKGFAKLEKITSDNTDKETIVDLTLDQITNYNRPMEQAVCKSFTFFDRFQPYLVIVLVLLAIITLEGIFGSLFGGLFTPPKATFQNPFLGGGLR